MNIQLKFEIGQTVYRIEGRAAQVGTIESYTIRTNGCLSNQHIEEYVVKYGNPSYPTRIKYLSTV